MKSIKTRPSIHLTQGQEHKTALHILFTLLVLAILANGLYFWLQKSQVLTSNAWQSYLQEVQEAEENPALEYPKLELEGFYAVPKPWIFTKLLKDFFIFAFAITSIAFLRRSKPHISTALILPALLGLSLTFAFLQSMYFYGTWVAVAGLRPIAYLAAGLLGVWATRKSSFDLLCRYLVAVLIIELMLALYEYWYGLPLFNTARFGNRINGTFLFPNSLGVFAVTACALAFSFSNINKLFLLVLAITFVYLTGSATALVLLSLMIAMWLGNSTPAKWKVAVRLVLFGIIAVMLLSLPQIVARHDVFDSIWGRIEPAVDYIKHSPPPAEVAFGKGLGIGSNIVNSVITQSDAVSEPAGIDLFHARADSTPLALINQVGIIGALLFYLVQAFAAWRDRKALPVYVVIFLAGLTTNVLELFPVNFLLGLLLCHSLLTSTERKP